MTTLVVEGVGPPSSGRQERALDAVRERAADDLGGRTVWCASALPAASELARQVLESLSWAGEWRVSTRALAVAADEPLRALTKRLEATLQGEGAEAPLGPADDEIYADAVRAGDALMGDEVAAGDIVVLYDALTAALAEDVRERGAHAVWHLRPGMESSASSATGAWTFLRRHTPGIDAVVTTWMERGERGYLVERVGALMPSAGLLTAKEIAPAPSATAVPPYKDVAWASVLSDIVHDDRREHVGGLRRPRPAVAAR